MANPTFLLERLGSECGDLQFLRELTVNGLDAIAAQPGPARGRVVWDLDWQRLEASAGKVRKLTVTDTGTGMRPDQLGRYINQLASSSREQSHTANFGVGAKLAAGSRNPHGLEYRSWHQGHGAPVRFKRHPDGAGASNPTLARRPPRLLATTRRAGQAVAAARAGPRHPGRLARPPRARRHHPGAQQRDRRPAALNHPLPQQPLPTIPRRDRRARPRPPRPRPDRTAHPRGR